MGREKILRGNKRLAPIFDLNTRSLLETGGMVVRPERLFTHHHRHWQRCYNETRIFLATARGGKVCAEQKEVEFDEGLVGDVIDGLKERERDVTAREQQSRSEWTWRLETA